MRWVAVILVMCGIFYLGTRFLQPSATTIDVNWMEHQIRIGMSQDEVRHDVGGDPNYVVKGGMGQDETWYFTDRYNPETHLAIEFIDGHVYRKAIEK